MGRFWELRNLQEKMLHGSTFVFGVVPRFDAANAADGWLDGGRSAPLAEWTARGGCWLTDSLDDAFERSLQEPATVRMTGLWAGAGEWSRRR